MALFMGKQKNANEASCQKQNKKQKNRLRGNNVGEIGLQQWMMTAVLAEVEVSNDITVELSPNSW